MKKLIGLSFVLSLIFTQNSKANVLGVDIQHYNPTSSSLGYLTVHSGQMLKPSQLALGVHVNYAVNNLLIYDDPVANQERLATKDSLSGFDLAVAFGVSENLEIGANIPGVLGQTVDKEQYRSVFITSGASSFRPHIKYNFLRSSDLNSGLVLSIDVPSVRDDPYTGLNPQPVTTVESYLDWGNFAVNLGYRMRQPGAQPEGSPLFPLDDQWIYSAGYSLAFAGKYSFIGEVIGSMPAQKAPYKHAGDISSLELLGGVRGPMGIHHIWQVGAGFELMPKSLSPDYRLFAGLVFYFGGEREPRDILIEDSQKEDGNVESAFTPYVDDEQPYETAEDSDLDGVADNEDKCPKSKMGEVVDRKGCTVIADEDSDGVEDSYDRCPNTPFGTPTDSKGCPVKVNRPKPLRTITLKGVLFDFNHDTLKANAEKSLSKVVAEIHKMRYRSLIVEGHTDERGSLAYNRGLSLRRAQRVKQFLVKNGFSRDVIKAEGYGEQKPVASNSNPSGRAKNRRVEIKVYGEDLK